MRFFLLATAALLPILSGGCVANTMVGVATMPVRATGRVVDWTTTSQSEADRNAGRKARKQGERRARECRKEGGTDCNRFKRR